VVHEAAKRAEDALQRVPLPGYGIDIVSAGLVEKIRVGDDGAKVMVALGYEKAKPGGSFCRFTSAAAWKKIIEDTLAMLRGAGFQYMPVVDADSGGILAEHDSQDQETQG
jgi:hypothetical protein